MKLAILGPLGMQGGPDYFCCKCKTFNRRLWRREDDVTTLKCEACLILSAGDETKAWDYDDGTEHFYVPAFGFPGYPKTEAEWSEMAGALPFYLRDMSRILG